MDPISQGAMGAIVAGSLPRDREQLRLAVFTGWAGGMLADADFFIRSENDQLLNVEFHRHFSHSLLFIPLGGLICAAMLWLVFLLLRKRKKFAPLLLFSTAGYATAGLLDACTSYGTRLLWPFSDQRIAWNIISIVDPIFTLTILVLLGLGLKKRSVLWPRLACVFAMAYLSFGVVQNYRAVATQRGLISDRGHSSDAVMMTVKPSIGNLLLWRSIYRHGDQFYVDAVRVGLSGGQQVFDGTVVDAVDLDDLLAGVPGDSVLASDLKRFDHFSAGYLARHPDQPDVIGDLRYAMVPNTALPLWGIRYERSEFERHVSFENFRETDSPVKTQFFGMLFGR